MRKYKYRPYVAEADLSKTSEEKIQEVIKLYQEGWSQTKIETTLKMTRKTIKTILKQKGIDRSKSQQFRISRNNYLRDDCFDELNEESSYWIGFLYADGGLCNSSNSVELSLAIVDIGHIVKFKRFLNCTNKLEVFTSSGFGKGEMCRIRINSDKIKQRLQSLGFTNDKSHDAVPPEELKYNKHFWRGVIDGDGCISVKDKNLTISLCGTKETIEGFIEFVKTITPTEAKARKTNPRTPTLFQTMFDRNKAKLIIENLYKGSNIYLDRKYQKYLNNY
jgi:hypothetical protein